MEPLHMAPGNANNVVSEHTMGLSSSEEELMHRLNHCLEHGNISIQEERALMKHFKLHEEKRKKDVASAPMKEKIIEQIEGSSVFTDMRTLIDERRHEEYLEQRKKGKELLPMALRELPNPYNPMREEGMGLCSSEEELNKLIHSLNYRIEHENISIVEKRQLMKKIYRLEGTRKRVIENDFMKAKMQDSKSNSQDQTEGALVLAELRPIIAEKRRYTEYLEPKRKEMEPLYTTPGDFRNAINAVSEKDMGLDSSEDELIELMHSLNYGIQNGSILDDRELRKAIKQLGGMRRKCLENASIKLQMQLWRRVIENSSMKAKMQDSRTDVQGQVKQLGVDFDGEKKELQPLGSKIKSQDEKMKFGEGEVSAFNVGLQDEVLNKDHDRKASEDGDITGLEALSGAESHRFMSQFSSYKEFREDYERRILSSEKPISFAKAPRPNESEMPEQEETNEAVESGANGKVEIIRRTLKSGSSWRNISRAVSSFSS